MFYLRAKDESKSQMLFSSKVLSVEIVENFRSSDPVKTCTEMLQKQCEEFDFKLNGSSKTAQDMSNSLDRYHENRPCSWKKLFDVFLPYRKNSYNLKHKCDNVFQIMFNLVHNGSKKTSYPLHIGIAEAIHGMCHSKNANNDSTWLIYPL